MDRGPQEHPLQHRNAPLRPRQRRLGEGPGRRRRLSHGDGKKQTKSMTVESQFWFGDTLVRRLGRADGPSPRALVVFHGFPGQPTPGQASKYAGLPKFRVELAKAVAARLGWDAYLPGYDGLGDSRGTFSFERAVERSVDFA